MSTRRSSVLLARCSVGPAERAGSFVSRLDRVHRFAWPAVGPHR